MMMHIIYQYVHLNWLYYHFSHKSHQMYHVHVLLIYHQQEVTCVVHQQLHDLVMSYNIPKYEFYDYCIFIWKSSWSNFMMRLESFLVLLFCLENFVNFVIFLVINDYKIDRIINFLHQKLSDQQQKILTFYYFSLHFDLFVDVRKIMHSFWNMTFLIRESVN